MSVAVIDVPRSHETFPILDGIGHVERNDPDSLPAQQSFSSDAGLTSDLNWIIWLTQER